MSYPERVNQQAEAEQPNKDLITWEAVTPEQLNQIVDDTLADEIMQTLSAINLTLPVLEQLDPQALKEAINNLKQYTSQTMAGVRAIQQALRTDPEQKIPIDHRYEEGGGKPILALEMLITTNPFNKSR